MEAPKVIPRKHSLLRILPVNGKDTITNTIHAEREVELLNHCSADVEHLMGRLQQAANAQREQSTKKKRSKKNRKKQEYDLSTAQASPLPSEQDFVDIFQKIKYSFSLLDRLKAKIAAPKSEELLHHLFVPLTLMVKTTGSPDLAAGVSSPALTRGAISLLDQNLSPVEKELWKSLGPNWTHSYSQQSQKPISPYTPVFLDGWKPEASDANGHAFGDPVESQNKYDAFLEQKASQRRQSEADSHSPPLSPEDQVDGVGQPLQGQLYRCCYDFVARNNNELSVLHGETLQVLDSSKRWWKCRNNYDQIGFVPSTLLEPIDDTEPDSRMDMPKTPIKSPLAAGRFSYVPSSPTGDYPASTVTRPFSMAPVGGDGERVMLINNELAQRLANGAAERPGSVFINKNNNTVAPLNYHSPPEEVKEWLGAKGFSVNTVCSLGILTGAQLFSLSKRELCKVSPQEGARVYGQIMVQKAQLEAERNVSELKTVMNKQKMKVDPITDDEEL